MSRGSRCAVALVLLLLSSLPRAAHGEAASPKAPEPDPHVPFPPPSPRRLVPAEDGYTYAQLPMYPSFPWLLLQGVPSPEIAVGSRHEPVANGPPGATESKSNTDFGLRWQLTPLVWSWGVNRHISPWRFLVVDPLARHSGSLELSTSFEYIFGYVDRAIVRPGVRAYLPLAHHGEYLSVSFGTSTYAFDSKMRVAYDVGAYVLYGIFGIQATVAPENGPLTAIGTFRIRYF